MKISKTLLLAGVSLSALTSCNLNKEADKLDVTYNVIYATFTEINKDADIYERFPTIEFINNKRALSIKYRVENGKIEKEVKEYDIKYNSEYINLTESIDGVDHIRIGEIIPGKDFLVRFYGLSAYLREVYSIVPKSVTTTLV